MSVDPIPAWWTSREIDIRAQMNRIRLGRVECIATSPGGRPVMCAAYGDPEPELRGRANFNSAIAACDPNEFFRRVERRRPVLMIIAGVHGHETEGMIGALSLIRLLEAGVDLLGRPQPELLDVLSRLRVIAIPLANPDGRARVPLDGLVGRTLEEMRYFGQGTRRDGTHYGWPGCKAVHPMTGDVGYLGGYFDDNGINLMHDEWPSPMSSTTLAMCRLVREEGPDVLLNLHSYERPPGFLPVAYLPIAVKRQARAMAERCFAAWAALGIPTYHLPNVDPDGVEGLPPALNLASMLYHCGAALPFLFESPHGLSDCEHGFSYQQILDIHHALFRVAANELLAGREG